MVINEHSWREPVELTLSKQLNVKPITLTEKQLYSLDTLTVDLVTSGVPQHKTRSKHEIR